MSVVSTLVSVVEVKVPIRTYYFIRIRKGTANVLRNCFSSLFPTLIKDVGDNIFMIGFSESKDVFNDIQNLIDFHGIKLDTSLVLRYKLVAEQKGEAKTDPLCLKYSVNITYTCDN